MKVRLTRPMTKEELAVALALGAKDAVDFVYGGFSPDATYQLDEKKAERLIDIKQYNYCWLFEPIEEKPIG